MRSKEFCGEDWARRLKLANNIAIKIEKRIVFMVISPW